MNLAKIVFAQALISLAGILIFSCGGSNQENGSKKHNPETLEGSWRLVKTIEHGAEDTTNRRDGNKVVYQKHITPTHFMWVEYNLDEKELLGTGGGTYTYDGSTYIEDIHFFYPPGSNERGQRIKFNVDFKEGGWRHTGYVKVYDFDPESGDNLVSDSIIIDEIWAPIEATTDNDVRLTGTWELASYKEVNDSVYSEYPGFVAYYKHLTPTHFAWVHFNRDGDALLAAGAGPYTLVGEDYTESLKIVHPGGVMMNQDFNFKATFDANGRWIHEGMTFNADNDGDGAADTAIVDEIWKRYAGPVM